MLLTFLECNIDHPIKLNEIVHLIKHFVIRLIASHSRIDLHFIIYGWMIGVSSLMNIKLLCDWLYWPSVFSANLDDNLTYGVAAWFLFLVDLSGSNPMLSSACNWARWFGTSAEIEWLIIHCFCFSSHYFGFDFVVDCMYSWFFLF